MSDINISLLRYIETKIQLQNKLKLRIMNTVKQVGPIMVLTM